MFSSTFYEEALPLLPLMRKHPTTTNVAQTADKERKKWARTETNADRKVYSLSQVITYLQNSSQSGFRPTLLMYKLHKITFTPY